MIYTYKYIILLLFILTTTSFFGQQNASYEEYFKKVLYKTNSPNNWNFKDFSKEGSVDVSTGKFEFTIPFTTIENEYLSLPVSFTYSSSGVRVDENASEVGMGWNLITGGQITRKQNGVADEMRIPLNPGIGGSYSYSNMFVRVVPEQADFGLYQWRRNNSLTTKGFWGSITKSHFDYYSNYFPKPRVFLSNADNDPTGSIPPSDYLMTSILQMQALNIPLESERDIFHVVVGDLNFHFMFKIKDSVFPDVENSNNNVGIQDFEAIAIDDKDIKIDVIFGQDNFYYNWTSENPGGIRVRNNQEEFITGFLVTDKKGVKYYFNDYTFTEPQYLKSLMDHSQYSTNNFRSIQYVMQDVQVNNWGLTKIEFPNNTIITYSYLKTRISEEKIVPRQHDGEYTGHPYNFRPQKLPYGIENIDLEYEKLYLNEISSDNFKVKLNYNSNVRSDLKNGKRLENIQLFDFKNLLIKQVNLISDYKGTTTSNNLLSKRLFLNSIIEKNIVDGVNIQFDDTKDEVYHFDYFNADNLPSKNKIGFQDLYGYYLGNTIENAYPPFPKLYINPNNEGNKISYYPIDSEYIITFNGVERRPNPNTVNYGSMKEIKFPTGGSIAIEYEPNTFYDSITIDGNLNGPGCRVNSLKYFSQKNVLGKIKKYTYNLFDKQGTSSGKLMYKPSFAYIANYVIDNSLDLSVEQTHQYGAAELPYHIFGKYTTTGEKMALDGITSLSNMYKKLITTSTHNIGPQEDYFGREIIYTNVQEEEVSNVDNSGNGKLKYYNYYTDNRIEVNITSGPTDDFTYIPPGSRYVYDTSGNENWAYAGAGNTSGLKVKYGFVEKKGKDIFPFPERNYFGDNDALKIGKTYKTEIYNKLNQKIEEINRDYKLLSNSSYKMLNFNLDYLHTYYHSGDDSSNRLLPYSGYKSGLYFYSIDSLYTNQKLVIEKEEIINYNNNSISNTTQNYFNNSFLVNKISRKNSNLLLYDDNFYYPNDYDYVQGDDYLGSINKLKLKNRISEVIKYETTVNNQVTKSILKEFTENPTSNGDSFSVVHNVYSKKGYLNILNLSEGELGVTYEQYDSKGNLLQYRVKENIPVAIIWGYNKSLPIAKIENATYNQISSYIDNLQTLSDAGSEASLIIALNNLRTDPALANTMITTYTYKPLIGVSTITDPRGMTTYYEYDSFNRLSMIKDRDKNVLQSYCYNYKGQSTDCATETTVFTSKDVIAPFTKNNCASGGVGSILNYAVAPAAYTSTISQADADAKAQADVIANGQNYANTNGTCTFSSVVKSGSFTKNNCASGSTTTYTVAAGSYTSTISQADADAKAQADVITNGQNYANANGTCNTVFLNVAKSSSFRSQDCGIGQLGKPIIYTVPAGRYTSTISQTDADSKAQSDINNNGQNYANDYGTCYNKPGIQY